MEGEIMVVMIVAIGCATGIITTWINSRKKTSGYDDETFERLAKAFMRYKKESEQRIQNLEAIIADDNSSEPKQIDEPKGTIEIEDNREKSKSDDGNLRNMLRE